MSALTYLSINVYQASNAWLMTVLLREPGKPWPRLDRTIVEPLPLGEHQDLPSALEAAAEALRNHAATMRG